MNKPVAFVIGSSGLLGPIWTNTLQDEGYSVCGIDPPLLDVRRDYKEIGITLDLLARTWGVPELVLYNAGVDAPPSDGATSDFWTDGDIMAVNYFGAKKVLRWTIGSWGLFSDGKPRRIIVIGSLMGSVAADHRNYPPGFDKPVDYGASKRALLGLVVNLATRHAPKNVLVNMMSFAGVEGKGITGDFAAKYLPKVPMGRFATPDDCANALRMMVMQTYLTGQEVLFDGGYTKW
jgi:NAD(P)-dependent dehydrogenase (short-subunit alcohol dehydrogenase family)